MTDARSLLHGADFSQRDVGPAALRVGQGPATHQLRQWLSGRWHLPFPQRVRQAIGGCRIPKGNQRLSGEAFAQIEKKSGG